MKLEHPHLKDFYRKMLEINLLEQTLLDLFAQGEIRGTVHTCLGQEATAVGVVGALDKSLDIICSNHRGHGHFLAYCEDVRGLLAEIMGKPQGICAGIGGSQHIHKGNFYSNGILGGMVAVANGMALAERERNSGAVVAVFFGDGALAEGIVYETMNLAALWKLPILFAIEHNHYAQSTFWQSQHAGSLPTRGSSFGIPTKEVDGNDVEAVFNAASSAVGDIRNGSGPHILFMHTYRMGPHSKGDDLRDKTELSARLAQTPLVKLKAILNAEWCEQTGRKIKEHLAEIVQELARGNKP